MLILITKTKPNSDADAFAYVNNPDPSNLLRTSPEVPQPPFGWGHLCKGSGFGFCVVASVDGNQNQWAFVNCEQKGEDESKVWGKD